LRAVAAVTPREGLGGKIVYVLDLLADSVAAGGDALRALISAFRDEADAVAMCALPRSVPARLARAGGLLPVPRRFESNPLWLAVYDVYGDRQEQLLGPWSPTWGDMDHL
jgi:hypothetical protein